VTAASKDWEKGNAWNGVKRAVAVVHPTAGHQARGVIHFVETGGKVRVTADLEGLEPNQKHGFHIHEFGDCSSHDALSAGEHYNPEGHPHALPPVTPRHAGDLGNVQADASGKAQVDLTTDTITVAGARNPIIGRAIIVHGRSDTGAQPSGAAGPRVGCGVIGVSGAKR
jgi:Cu-Zn family superoxide dismutase